LLSLFPNLNGLSVLGQAYTALRHVRQLLTLICLSIYQP
jgi:hypothetical protein